MEDRKLKERVERELEWDPAIDASRVGVTVKDGIVTLTGHVPDYVQRIVAERAVKRVKGFRGLAQDLEVRPADGAGAPDDEVAACALRTLDWNVSVPKNSIQVRVDDGHIILAGEVDYDYQRKAAEECLVGLRGVVRLTNHVTVRPRGMAPDLKHRIEAALERQAHLDAGKIVVLVQDGKVRLEGAVRAAYQRDIAKAAVLAAPGVTAVDDHIEIGA
ncbi:MAG: BON domain-containing protein [Pseudomonadota bacterium]